MATVRDLENHVKRISDDLSGLSEKHRAFMQKLNRLGARNLATRPPENYPIIDATVELTEEEYSALLQEFRQIHHSF